MIFAIDLFCGAGGMSEGLKQAGFHVLFSSDISSDVQKTYMHRHKQLGYIQGENTYFHKGDINEISGDFIWQTIKNLKMFQENGEKIPDRIDAVFGGPPCQGFSRAGRRKSNDPRNLLFKEYLRVINELQPRYVVMENVEGFNDTKFYDFTGNSGYKYSDNSRAPQILLNEFNILGYNVLNPKVLDASDYGVPQRRRRAIFIAYKQGEKTPHYPKPLCKDTCRVTVQQAIGDLVRQEKASTKLELTAFQIASRDGRTSNIHGEIISHVGLVLNNELSNHQALVTERFSLFLEGEDGKAVRKRIIANGINLKSKKHLVADCSKKIGLTEIEIIKRFQGKDCPDDLLNCLLTKKSIRTRLSRDKPSLTMVTLPDDYISPFEDRVFSVREMARLQSFDDSFEFLSKRTTGGLRRKVDVPQYTQVGNAVPPLLAKAIASEVLKAIQGVD